MILHMWLFWARDIFFEISVYRWGSKSKLRVQSGKGEVTYPRLIPAG